MTREKFDAAVDAYGQACFEAGLQEGLRVAERIALLLTAQPDTARQARLREQAERLMREAGWKGRLYDE